MTTPMETFKIHNKTITIKQWETVVEWMTVHRKMSISKKELETVLNDRKQSTN